MWHAVFLHRFFRRRFYMRRTMSIDSQEEDSLLSRSSIGSLVPADMPGHHTLLGQFRAYWLGAVVCLSGFLMGYDTGIVGGVLTLTSFTGDFRADPAHQARTNSLTVSLQQAGAFVACFLVWPFTHRFGRRKSIMLGSFIFCIGAMIETISTHSLAAFYVGRVIAGIGLGGATVIVPMYNSEMAPKELRGRIGCFFQLFFTFGIFTSYWTDYGVDIGIPSSTRQWQIPIGLQMVPAALMGLGALTLKDSVRWYVQKNRLDEAWDSLKWIRGSDGPAVRAEMEEIKMGVQIETLERAGFQFKELLQPHNFKLISAGFLVFCAQQATGATAFAYFGPQYFALLAGTQNSTRNLLLTGIFGAVKIVACLTFVLFCSERFGRRTAFIWGSGIMAAIFYTSAGVIKSNPPPPDAKDPPVTAAGKATIALIYLFVMVYNGSWGPLPWPYVSEIFPSRIREPGIAVGVSSQWLWNFVFSLTTPYMIVNLGWATFLVWGVFNTVICIGSIIFFKETRGLSLEEINAQLSGKEKLLHDKVRTSGDFGEPGADSDETRSVQAYP